MFRDQERPWACWREGHGERGVVGTGDGWQPAVNQEESPSLQQAAGRAASPSSEDWCLLRAAGRGPVLHRTGGASYSC